MTNLHDFPDKEFASKCFTHNVETLLFHAGLKAQREQEAKRSPRFDDNWQILKDWDVDDRYQIRAAPDARELFEAVTDPSNGVLPWIMARW